MEVSRPFAAGTILYESPPARPSGLPGLRALVIVECAAGEIVHCHL